MKRLIGQGRSRPARMGRRGFLTMLVLTSMIFLSAAIVGLSTLFAHEARRTRAVIAEAQLRQFLLAGVPAAQAELAANGNTQRDVPMAVPVEGANVSLHVLGAGSANDAEVRVAGIYRGFRASQTVRFTRVAGGWMVSDARLEQTGQQ